MFRLAESETRAIAIACDELEAYTGTVGDEDESHQSQEWAVKKLHALLERWQRTEARNG